MAPASAHLSVRDETKPLILIGAVVVGLLCDINANFSLEPSTMSHHLKVLRDAGFLTNNKRGLWVFYKLDPAAEPAVRRMLA